MLFLTGLRLSLLALVTAVDFYDMERYRTPVLNTETYSSTWLDLRSKIRRRDEGQQDDQLPGVSSVFNRMRDSKSGVNFVRENRAIETTLKNVVDNTKNRFPIWSEKNLFTDNENGNGNGNGEGNFHQQDDRDEFEKAKPYESYDDEDTIADTNPAELLEELKALQGSKYQGQYDNLGINSERQGRRRKLTSQEQGALLVEALRKRRNYTTDDDPRGQGTSSVQSSIMDMLGRSTPLRID